MDQTAELFGKLNTWVAESLPAPPRPEIHPNQGAKSEYVTGQIGVSIKMMIRQEACLYISHVRYKKADWTDCRIRKEALEIEFDEVIRKNH